MSESFNQKKILDFCIQFVNLTFHEKFTYGIYKSDCGEHQINYENSNTISKVGHKSKIVFINNEILKLSFTARLFFCLWSFMRLNLKTDEHTDLITIIVMETVWDKLNLSDKDLSNELIIFFTLQNPSVKSEKRIENIINFLRIKRELNIKDSKNIA